MSRPERKAGVVLRQEGDLLRLINRLEVGTGHGYRVNALVLLPDGGLDRERSGWYYDETARFTLVNFNSVLAYAESTL